MPTTSSGPRGTRKLVATAAFITLVLAGPVVVPGAAVAAPALDWTAFHHGPRQSNAAYGDLAITPANVPSLTPAWSFTAQPSTVSGAPAPAFDASPTVAAGRVFIASKSGILYALDAASGAVRWTKALDFGSAADCAVRGVVSTAAVAVDPVTKASTLYAAGSHYLYALDPATGAQRWKAAIGPATAAGEARYYNWSSPLVVGGKITMGLTAACDDLIRGGVVELDQHTGKRLHTYYTVPAGKVGADVWSSQAGDGTNIWVTTGNAVPSAGQPYDAFAIVRLSADTFVKQEKWAPPTTTVSDDLDMGGSPSFITATIGGVSTPLIGTCNKNGVFYVWRRNNLAAGPVWQRQVGQVGGTNHGACITSPAFDAASNAVWVAANQTTINGVAAQGSIRQLNAATGAIMWERPLTCLPDGSPTLNASTHVVAVPLYQCPAGVSPGVALFNSATGAPLRTITTTGRVFAQPVFAEGKLFVADESGLLRAFAP
jgi:outer membrane protein assembly factor BamB